MRGALIVAGFLVSLAACSSGGHSGSPDGGSLSTGPDSGTAELPDAGAPDAGAPSPDGGRVITHGDQLTLADVGPGALGITSFTDVSGGTFTGTPLSDWGAVARTLGAGGETIDGFAFPAGTVVLERANLTSEVTVTSGWLVLRGCKGSILFEQPVGDGGGGAALYSELTAFNAAGRKDGYQPAEVICHRCYFPHSGLENVYSDHVTITESWIAPDPGATGDHVDGIQTWGGQRNLDFSRNHLEWNGAWNSTQSGLIGMYSDGAQGSFDGYDQVSVTNNLIVIGAGGGIGLHAPMGVATTNMGVTGNRWSWDSSFSDPNYTPAVYSGSGAADYTSGGNTWSDNRWSDGPYAGQFLWPDNSTHSTDY